MICCGGRILLPWFLVLLAALRADTGSADARAVLPVEAGPVPALRLHMSEKASFLHFLDTLSRWSPYCGPVDPSYLGIPSLSAADQVWLQRYSSSRQRMGYAAETDLLLWAEAGFPLAGRSAAHAELKAAVEHFRSIREFRDPLSRRMKTLERLRRPLGDAVSRLQAGMLSLRGVAVAFRVEGEALQREIPVFVVYNLAARNFQGGAHGDGLYAEVDPSASPDDLLRRPELLHEYLHVALRPRDRLRAFAASRPELDEWQRALSGTAPDERGNSEAAMLDEILVYTLADVVLGSRDAEAEMQNYAALGDKEKVRLWDGVRNLLPLIRGQLEEPLPRQEFLSRLIAAFLSQVHFRVWSCPSGITIAAKPSAP